MITREARLPGSRRKVLPPFSLDESMCFYCPQENVEAFNHPRVKDFHRFLLNAYQPDLPSGRRILLLLPCTKTKPYPASAEHTRINSALLGVGFTPTGEQQAPAALLAARDTSVPASVFDVSPLVRGDLVVHRMVISEPLGLVPYEHVYWWRGAQSPATSYDDPGLFENRGTSVCPWRADSTARTAASSMSWLWGDQERRAYVESHNRLAHVIAGVLARLGQVYSRRIAWVSPGLTHKSFLLASKERSEEGVRQGIRTSVGVLPLEGANDLHPGLVEVHPTVAETQAALRRLTQRVLGTEDLVLSQRAAIARFGRGDGGGTPLALPELLDVLLELLLGSQAVQPVALQVPAS